MNMKYASLLLVVLAGCAFRPATWHKAGSTGSDFYADRGQCNAQAYSVTGAPPMQVAIVFNSCMQGKGWQLYRDQ
jgi:hypothetical protein